MNIHLATDHAGFELKEMVKEYLSKNGYSIMDHGAFEYDALDDYPDFIFPAAKAVAIDAHSRGIIFGGSGQGEAMAANRIKGVRAVVFYGGNQEIPSLSRQHNNANILSVGARFVSSKEMIDVIEEWLATPFQGGRHTGRIQKLDDETK
ncbi:MAG: RpiB/LacA/LacB family sugar-phosphate isomerase [Candidatus Marinimicrobia bacterium]|jgi:ribose 5-phosphate isomerase B|nr:RpiB/LacA/LacB family sugar-phosphate isomerase [Candidatus Neomarinimicrobiota bacterium]